MMLWCLKREKFCNSIVHVNIILQYLEFSSYVAESVPTHVPRYFRKIIKLLLKDYKTHEKRITYKKKNKVLACVAPLKRVENNW